MALDRTQIKDRTLNIYVYKKGTPDEFFVIAPEDEILMKTGDSYKTLTPTADLFVSSMYGLKYSKVAFLEPPSIGRESTDGMNKITNSSQDMNVGRTSVGDV